jgi:hypothetical protein
LIRSGTQEGKQLEQKLLSRQFREHDTHNASNTIDQSAQLSLNDIAQAVAFKDKLIEFDRTRFVFSHKILLKFIKLNFSAQRTQVIDDAADYFDSNNKWLSKQQRMKLEKLQTQLEDKKKTNDKKITIDFAGRRIFNEKETPNDRL